MQFKMVGRKVQVLAYRGYDKDRKRAIVKMLGSFDGYSGTPTVELLNSLTQEEKGEMEAWLAKRDEGRRAEGRQASVDYLVHALASATKALQDGALPRDPERYAAEAWAGLDELMKAMKKAGLRRPAKPAKVAPAVPGQTALKLEG